MTNNTDKRLLLLHRDDNIFVCCQKVMANETIELEGERLTLTADIDIGHKLARRPINTGEKVLKYGVSIGSAKTDIRRADHVHLHNLKSDYMPSYQRSGRIDDSPQSGELPL